MAKKCETICHLLISTVVTDGLVNNMAPGLLFTMLMVVCFALFVINGVALFHPFGFGYGYLVLSALLTLDLGGLSHHGDRYRVANLNND